MIKKFVNTYEEMADLIGEEDTIKIYHHFRGQQIVFPQRLYSIEFIEDYIKNNYDGSNLHDIARKFGYTDRRIRQILKKVCDNN